MNGRRNVALTASMLAGNEVPSLEQVETSYNVIGVIISGFQKKFNCSFVEAMELFSVAYERESASIRGKMMKDMQKEMKENPEKFKGDSGFDF